MRGVWSVRASETRMYILAALYLGGKVIQRRFKQYFMYHCAKLSCASCFLPVQVERFRAGCWDLLLCVGA